MAYAQTRNCPEKLDAKNLWGFDLQTDHLIPASNGKKKKKKKKRENMSYRELCRPSEPLSWKTQKEYNKAMNFSMKWRNLYAAKLVQSCSNIASFWLVLFLHMKVSFL